MQDGGSPVVEYEAGVLGMRIMSSESFIVFNVSLLDLIGVAGAIQSKQSDFRARFGAARFV